MKPQTAEEVAERIADAIKNPVAELYTNPASMEIARRYYADVAAFERGGSSIPPTASGSAQRATGPESRA